MAMKAQMSPSQPASIRAHAVAVVCTDHELRGRSEAASSAEAVPIN